MLYYVLGSLWLLNICLFFFFKHWFSSKPSRAVACIISSDTCECHMLTAVLTAVPTWRAQKTQLRPTVFVSFRYMELPVLCRGLGRVILYLLLNVMFVSQMLFCKCSCMFGRRQLQALKLWCLEELGASLVLQNPSISLWKAKHLWRISYTQVMLNSIWNKQNDKNPNHQKIWIKSNFSFWLWKSTL